MRDPSTAAMVAELPLRDVFFNMDPMHEEKVNTFDNNLPDISTVRKLVFFNYFVRAWTNCWREPPCSRRPVWTTISPKTWIKKISFPKNEKKYTHTIFVYKKISLLITCSAPPAWIWPPSTCSGGETTGCKWENSKYLRFFSFFCDNSLRASGLRSLPEHVPPRQPGQGRREDKRFPGFEEIPGPSSH